VFVEVGERRSYRLEQGETEGAFRPVRMAGGQTQSFPLSLPLDDSAFQDVLAPHEVVLRRRPREALPSGRYVLVGTCNLKQHPGSRARLSWTGSISAHAGVVEVP
jgi:hypothetical protein